MDLPPDFRELLAEFARSGVDLERASEALDRFGAPSVVVEAVRNQAPTDIVYLGQPPLRVDLLCTIDGVDPAGLAARAITAEIDGVTLRVIDHSDLIANKRAVGRPQDLIDAAFLERVRASRAKSK
jgi:hypothetical protein